MKPDEFDIITLRNGYNRPHLPRSAKSIRRAKGKVAKRCRRDEAWSRLMQRTAKRIADEKSP